MGTTLFYVTVSLILTAHISSSQMTGFRDKQDAESKARFNFFDLELLKSLASSQKGNLLVSPASVKAALAMVLEGAGGKSAKELQEALRLTNDVKSTRTQFRNFINSLQMNTPGTKVEAANQIFLSQNITPHPQYETMLKNYYYSNIEKVDFSKAAIAAQTINRWVNMLTHGLIPTLVDPGSLSANTKLMLANAMYFKGKWKHSFDYDKTSVKCFYVDVNICLDTYVMESVNFYKFGFIPSLNAHAVQIPYEGDKFSLLLLLPTKVDGIDQLVRDMSHVSLHNIVPSLHTTEILVSIPRFKIDYNTDLLNKLYELGIQEIFTEQANLTGMIQWGSPDLHISNVLHKAKIEVNEEGTVAAAATGTVVVPLMGTTLPKLIFNHPFIFFLRNEESGDILFAGRLSEPEGVNPTPRPVTNGSPTQSESVPRPVVVAGIPTTSSLNPPAPVAPSPIPVNLGNNIANASSNRLPIQPNTVHPIYLSRNFNSNEASLVHNLPISRMSGNIQAQANDVQYQSNVKSNTFVAPPYVNDQQNVPPPTQQNAAQFAPRSNINGAQYVTSNVNGAQYVPSNASGVQYTPMTVETSQVSTGDSSNQSYNDRIHFS